MLKSRRAHVFPGGTITTKFWDRIVFTMSTLRPALTGFMGFRFFLCAGFCLTQLQGIPIGGPLSPIILHIVLSECEYLADAAWTNRQRRVLCTCDVDDLLFLSCIMCHNCLHLHIQDVQGHTVMLDVVDIRQVLQGSVVFPYLEMELHVAFNRFLLVFTRSRHLR